MIYSPVRGVGRARRANRWTTLTITGFALAALVASATVSTAAAGSANAPGVTNKAVKIGYIFSETGVASSTFRNAGKAFQARIDRANAEGGVNGRKIDAVIIDDASSGANLTAAKDLVENQKVFAVVNNSSFAFLSYRYLLGAGVPVIGGGYDGSYYGQKGTENIISALGNGAPVVGITWDSAARVAKQLGAKKVAALAYGVAAGSAANAKGVQQYAVPANGLKAVYTNLSVDFGTTDTAPLVLGIKNSGADATYLPMVAATDIAIVQGLQQNGVDIKANILAQGYGQDLLDSPAAATLGPNTLFWQAYKPVELKTAATKRFQADLKKYAGLTGVPDYGQYLGYIMADMAVTGLEHAGKNPTRQGFVDGLHQLGTYDAAGLTCSPLDISLKNFGKYPATNCNYYEYVKDGKFVVYNKGKPVIGKIVGDPALLKANAAGELSTATTAAPTTVSPAP
jgi:branched-chain amino acid transport system substrate-binding protein